jgi:hypothetical protein
MTPPTTPTVTKTTKIITTSASYNNLSSLKTLDLLSTSTKKLNDTVSSSTSSGDEMKLNKKQILSLNSIKKSASNKILMIDDLDDDITSSDDLDDEFDDEDYDDTSSMSSPSSTSSSITNNIPTSGCSTPTKNSSKVKILMDTPESMEKPKKSSLKSTKMSQKRSNRIHSMGYSSDNPAEKRAFHILSERQRRNDLKKLFETLRTNIPVLCDKQKASKLTILKSAVDHLVEVANKRDKLSNIYEKEKQRHNQLLAQLKSLQQYNNNSNSNTIQYHHQSLNTNASQSLSMTTLAVH